MTRKEMFKSIKTILGVTKLPRKKDLLTSVLLQVSIEKWKGLLKYINEGGRIENNEHYPDASNCALCYKFIDNSKLICPISPVREYCKGLCTQSYAMVQLANTRKDFLEGRKMILKELKRALKNEQHEQIS